MIACSVKETEVRKIHEKSLYLLEKVGIRFQEPGVLELFKRKGIPVDGDTVYFPPAVVEEAVSTFRSSFEIRTPWASVEIGGGKTVLSGLSGARNVLKDGQTRLSVMEDYIEGRILDSQSPVIDVSDPLFIQIAGLPKDKDPLIKTAITLKYSKKPVIAYCDTEKNAVETLDYIRRFYDAPENGYYCMAVGNMISPFVYSKDDVEAILAFARRNQPVCITCCSLPGMTSPITVGGTIVQNNAEVLGGLVMTQIVNPGCPVIYGNLSFTSDMRRAVPVSWGPEVAVFIRYAKAMADFYHLPCRTGGALSSAKEVDWQDGAETAIAMMTAFDCGVDFVLHSCGGLDGLNTFSPEKFMLDEQLLMSRLSLNGRDFFTDESINLESIEEEGPGGNYLLAEDTLELYRTEIFYPKLFNTEPYHVWERDGRLSVFEKARREADRRIASFEFPQYEPWQNTILDEVLEGIFR